MPIPTRVGETPVVMINLNTTMNTLPTWAKLVDDTNRVAERDNDLAGGLLTSGQCVDTSKLISLLEERSYVPVRLVCIERYGGRLRMCLVMLRANELTEDDRPMSRDQAEDVCGSIQGR